MWLLEMNHTQSCGFLRPTDVVGGSQDRGEGCPSGDHGGTFFLQCLPALWTIFELATRAQPKAVEVGWRKPPFEEPEVEGWSGKGIDVEVLQWDGQSIVVPCLGNLGNWVLNLVVVVWTWVEVRWRHHSNGDGWSSRDSEFCGSRDCASLCPVCLEKRSIRRNGVLVTREMFRWFEFYNYWRGVSFHQRTSTLLSVDHGSDLNLLHVASLKLKGKRVSNSKTGSSFVVAMRISSIPSCWWTTQLMYVKLNHQLGCLWELCPIS